MHLIGTASWVLVKAFKQSGKSSSEECEDLANISKIQGKLNAAFSRVTGSWLLQQMLKYTHI